MQKPLRRRIGRRRFLAETGAAFAAVAAPTVVPSSALGRDGHIAPSERITMGCIGAGNQGFNDIRGFLGDERVQIVAVCDVNRESRGYWGGNLGGREPARRMIEEHYAAQSPDGKYKGCDACVDFREVLARDDVDTALLVLPDHWHAIAVIEAARAGKNIYSEKPLSLTIREGRAMSDAVRRNGRVFQTGSQQRSDYHFRHVCELVLNGRIGELHTVRCGLPGGIPDYSGGYGVSTQPAAPPDGFDYDRWLGPAPDAPYCPARCHVNFRWIYDYSGGQLTDWGGHHPDIAQWGMGTEHTGPVEIRNARAVYPDHALWNTATSYYFEAVYESGVCLIVSDGEQGGVRFEGTDGWVWANRGAYASEPASLLASTIRPDEIHLPRSVNHYRNFIDCVISRADPVAPIEAAHRSISVAHLGNIAMRLGRNLRWDPGREDILGDTEAARLLGRPYRAPWTL